VSIHSCRPLCDSLEPSDCTSKLQDHSELAQFTSMHVSQDPQKSEIASSLKQDSEIDKLGGVLTEDSGCLVILWQVSKHG
jgi:hypothetical protein